MGFHLTANYILLWTVHIIKLVLSSVVHEQKNRTLDKLKYISVFMKFSSFVRLLIYVLSVLDQAEDTKVVARPETSFMLS